MASALVKLPPADLTQVRIREILDQHYPKIDWDNDSVLDIKRAVVELVEIAK